ncbi:MAG TPA: hypothetical protein VGR20_15155, partial [Acidimicrobiia bacterium]|nr:hypothetical protein [Acidimicrobiia bacterium]
MDADAAGTEGPGEDAPPPAATAAGQGLTLIERRGAATWLGCTGDGATVICERVTLPPQARDVDGRFLRQRAAAVLTTSQPELLPVRRIVRKGGIIWMLSDVDDGVPLHRLLDRAKPSLAEAASLAALVLEAVAAMHGAGYVHGGLDSRSVRLGPGGGVRVAGWGPNALFPAELDGDGRRADLRATAGILAEIARSAGRPGRPLTETEEKLAARLASVADPRSLARRSPLKAAQGLDAAVGSPERRRAARQGLVDLARAVAAADAPISTGDAARGARSSGGTGRGGTGLAPGITGAGPAVTAPPGRSLPPPARRRPIWPRIWKGAAIGAVVAVVLGAELRFFGDSVQHNVNVLLSGNVRPAAAGPRRPAALPVLGPATAGPI